MTGNKKRLRNFFSIRALAPNVVTVLAFCMGLTAVRFALADKWELAVAAIIVAGVFDGLDGTVARLLRSTSKFGAELDSLSDVVAFGVVPALVIYLWALESLDRLGWAAALIYAVAMALRLARFNSRMDLDDENDTRKQMGFLTGVPAPMGAGLMVVPMVLDFGYTGTLMKDHPYFLAIYTIMVALLMISTLPTFTLKAVRVPRNSFVPVLLFVAIFFATLFVFPWTALLLIAIFYVASMPVCWIAYKKRSKELSDAPTGADAE